MSSPMWPEHETDRLRELWLKFSASEICAILRKEGIVMTRNAVIGKARRLNLPAKKPAGGPRTRWTEEAERIIRARWGECSVADLCQEVFDRTAINVSTSTISAKARAMGLGRHARSNYRPRIAKAPEPVVPKQEETPACEEVRSPPVRKVPLLGLGLNDCRFPLGDPRSPDFGFCGAPKWEGSRSYCEFHHRLCYRPADKRMRMRESVAA